jgi:threonine dehydrogenase-like Zn-dependent dehydrogenase
MAASFGTTPLAMEKAIMVMERGLIDPELVISHRFPLAQIHKAIEIMASPGRNKIILNP